MSDIYHQNRKMAWNGSYAYHANGRMAWNGSYAYHANGRMAWNGSYAYHANGKIAWNGSYAYHDSGQSAEANGIEVETGNGIRIVVGINGFRLYILGNCIVDESNGNEYNRYSGEQSKRSSSNIEISSITDKITKVSYSECDTCGQSFKTKEGYQAYIRNLSTEKRSDFAKYYFCTENCYYSKFENGHFCPVGKDGLTNDEREEQEKLSRQYNNERVNREKVEWERDREVQQRNKLEIEKKNIEFNIIKAQNDRKELRLAVIIGIPLLIFTIIFFIYKSNDIQIQKNKAVEINLELEQIEDSIKLYINNENYDRALLLTNRLIHPINELYEGKGTVWEGEYYDLYWDKKREEYKHLIFNRGSNEEKLKSEKKTNNDIIQSDKHEVKTKITKETKNDEKVKDTTYYDEELDEEYRN